MASKEIRLVLGSVALMSMYVFANVIWHMYEPKLNPPSPKTQALIHRGQQIAEQCSACHYLDQRANFVGPYLLGLLGRPVASVPGYGYSQSMRSLKGEWTPDRLSSFLRAPQTYAPGTNMAVKGWSDHDVQAVIAYFQSKE